MTDPSTPTRPDSPTAALDRVLTGPKTARTAAARVLEEHADDAAERVDALWSLGKAALEDNRIADSLALLGLAAEEAVDDPIARARIRCTLALALGADGRPNDAMAVLDDAEPILDGADLARLRNQRGMLLVDAGQLDLARHELMAAADGLRDAGDVAAEARTRCNLGVVTSLMGRLGEAETWFEQGRDLAARTDQALVVAGSESNLGYVAGRRGDFPTALRWYEAARAAFDRLGGVERSVATLETDHARTLIDAGLFTDAAEAARRALRSAQAGHNRTLEAQSHLLLGEALIELGMFDEASAALDRSKTLFGAADAAAMVRQVEHLSVRSSMQEPGKADVRRAVRTSAALQKAGWRAESLQAAIVAAEMGLDAGVPGLVRHLVTPLVPPLGRERGASRAARHHVRALLRIADGDRRGAKIALRAGLRALEEQRRLAASVELQAGLARRGEALAQLGTTLALEDGRAADVLRWADCWRGEAMRRPVAVLRADGHDPGLVERIRSTAAAVEAARLSGADHTAEEAELRRLEDELRHTRRGAQGGPRVPAAPDPLLEMGDLRRSVGDAALIHYVATPQRLAAVVVTNARARLFDLGSPDLIAGLAADQAEALRRMNRSARIAAAAREDLAAAADDLEGRLLIPLGDLGDRPLIVVPTGPVHGVQWAALPALRSRPFVVAPSARMWAEPGGRSRTTGVAVLAGPDLDHGVQEVLEVGRLHGRAAALVEPAADVATALQAFRDHGLVHIAAHGTFRTDNPLFSSLRFTDGPLNLFDLEGLEELPGLVVLGACDAGTAAVTANELIGTAAILLRLGVRNVVASSVEVDDAAVAALMVATHRRMVEGAVPAVALAEARKAAFDDGEAAAVAAASCTAVHATCFDPGVGRSRAAAS